MKPQRLQKLVNAWAIELPPGKLWSAPHFGGPSIPTLFPTRKDVRETRAYWLGGGGRIVSVQIVITERK